MIYISLLIGVLLIGTLMVGCALFMSGTISQKEKDNGQET